MVQDSGKVQSNRSQNVPYGGSGGAWDDSMATVAATPLQADTVYIWNLTYYTVGGGSAGAAAATASSTFGTGLYAESDWKGAEWIGGAMGQFRQTFAVAKPVAVATAYVVGLGYYKLLVNGEKVSTNELGAFTTFTSRVYYDTVDCTAAINAGVAGGGAASQAVGIVLGDGWYSLKRKGSASNPGSLAVDAGNPKLLFRLSLRYFDGTTQDVTSTTEWKYDAGPVTAADIYNGEAYNASLETPGWGLPEYDAAHWPAATSEAAPSSFVRITSHSILPPIRVTESFPACNMWESSPGRSKSPLGHRDSAREH